MSSQEYHVKVGPDRTEWSQNGKLHREGGPALEYVCGDKFWYRMDLLHRVDGPAIEQGNNITYYYLDGIRLTKEEHAARVNSPSTPNTPSLHGKVVVIDGREYTLILK
jgi:hypothetical protein